MALLSMKNNDEARELLQEKFTIELPKEYQNLLYYN